MKKIISVVQTVQFPDKKSVVVVLPPSREPRNISFNFSISKSNTLGIQVSNKGMKKYALEIHDNTGRSLIRRKFSKAPKQQFFAKKLKRGTYSVQILGTGNAKSSMAIAFFLAGDWPTSLLCCQFSSRVPVGYGLRRWYDTKDDCEKTGIPLARRDAFAQAQSFCEMWVKCPKECPHVHFVPFQEPTCECVKNKKIGKWEASCNYIYKGRCHCDDKKSESPS